MKFKPPMAQFRAWIAEIKHTLDSGRSQPPVPGPPEWYTGLAVSPASFSRQLGTMQIALQAARTSAKPSSNTVPNR